VLAISPSRSQTLNNAEKAHATFQSINKFVSAWAPKPAREARALPKPEAGPPKGPAL